MNVGNLRNCVVIGITLGCIVAVLGCDRDTSSTEPTTSCGGDIVSVDADDFCIYQQAVVVENAFSCPPDFPDLTIVGPIGICAFSGPLGDDLIDRIAREHRAFLPELWMDNCIDDLDCQSLQVCTEWACISSGMASNGTSNSTSNGTTGATSNGTTETSNGTTETSNGTTGTSNGTTATSNGTTATSNGTTSPQTLGFIQFVGLSNPIISIRGSGTDESTEVTFQVLDTDQEPLEGATVRFSLNSPPPQTALNRAETISDEGGFIRTTVQSGTRVGSFSVKANAIWGDFELEAVSPSIPVVAANPSRRGWQLNCDVRNMGGLIDRQGANITVDDTIACRTILLDRFQNPIGVERSIIYASEGGQVISPQLAVRWPAEQPEPPNDIGTAILPYRPLGRAPCDVAPMDGEPFMNVEGTCRPLNGCPDIGDACVQNPRDGLVTIVAMIRGEEEFNDVNANGAYDFGEPFWDAGEPFIDTNDNNTHDDGEPFTDIGTDEAPDGNGLYDGGNGVWDARSFIWVSTRVLLTGDPTTSDAHGYAYSGGPMVAYDGSTPLNEGDAGLWDLGVWWHDDNLNRLNASATYNATLDGPTNDLQLNLVSASTLEDRFGEWDVSYSTMALENDINMHIFGVIGWPDLTGYPYTVQIEAVGDNYGCTRIEDGCAVNFNVDYAVLPEVGAPRQHVIRVPFIVPAP